MTPDKWIATGTRHKVETPCGNVFVTVLDDDEGRPVKTFIDGAKNGKCLNVVMNATSRLMSLALENGASLEEIARQLAPHTCENAYVGHKSCFACLAKTLADEYDLDLTGAF